MRLEEVFEFIFEVIIFIGFLCFFVLNEWIMGIEIEILGGWKEKRKKEKLRRKMRVLGNMECYILICFLFFW